MNIKEVRLSITVPYAAADGQMAATLVDVLPAYVYEYLVRDSRLGFRQIGNNIAVVREESSCAKLSVTIKKLSATTEAIDDLQNSLRASVNSILKVNAIQPDHSVMPLECRKSKFRVDIAAEVTH